MNDFWLGYFAGVVGTVVGFCMLMFAIGFVQELWRRYKEHKAEKWDPIWYISKISESNKKPHLAQLDNFDIDYNTYATHRDSEHQALIDQDSELQALIEKMPRPASFISLAEELDLYHVDPARARHLTVVPDLEDTPRPTTMLDLGGEKPYCGALNPDPSYPYRCTRNAGHDKSEYGPIKKHGYGGVYWD